MMSLCALDIGINFASHQKHSEFFPLSNIIFSTKIPLISPFRSDLVSCQYSSNSSCSTGYSWISAGRLSAFILYLSLACIKHRFCSMNFPSSTMVFSRPSDCLSAAPPFCWVSAPSAPPFLSALVDVCYRSFPPICIQSPLRHSSHLPPHLPPHCLLIQVLTPYHRT